MKIFVTGGFSSSRPEDAAPVRTLGQGYSPQLDIRCCKGTQTLFESGL